MALMDLTTTIFSIQVGESVPYHSYNDKFRLNNQPVDGDTDPYATTDSYRGHNQDSPCDDPSDVKPGDSIIACVAHREETPLVEPARRIMYAFQTVNEHPHSLTGWVFGSDEKRCDFMLARDFRTGVSGRHFSIEIERKTKMVMIRNLSRHGTSIIVGTGSQNVQGVMVLIEQNVEVHAGGLHIRIAIPIRDKASEDGYERNLQEFLAAASDVPSAELNDLAFRSAEMTPDTLRGQKSDYFFCRSLGQGSFGSVDLAYVPSATGAIDWVAVKRVSDDSLTASKNLKKEINLLMTLSHV